MDDPESGSDESDSESEEPEEERACLGLEAEAERLVVERVGVAGVCDFLRVADAGAVERRLTGEDEARGRARMGRDADDPPR